MGGYTAYDFVVRLVRDDPTTAPPREVMWPAAIGDSQNASASAVALAAYGSGRLGDSAAAFERARQSPDPEIGATTGYNLGVVYGELGRSQDALAAYQRVIDDYGQDPAPALREIVACALEALQEGD